MSTTVNVSESSRNLGISRPTFNKYRAEGMPVDSPEAAREWITKRKASDGRGGNRTSGPAAGAFFALKEAQARANLAKTEAEARLRSFEADQAQKNLVSMDEARRYVAEVLAPLRVLLDSLPKACAVKANPADPQLAEDAVREAVDGIYKAMDRAREDGGNGS